VESLSGLNTAFHRLVWVVACGANIENLEPIVGSGLSMVGREGVTNVWNSASKRRGLGDWGRSPRL
jgi:hypothetical protein